MVQCVFAGGSTDDMCRVVLVLDEEVVMMKDVVRGVGGEFSNLATGTYTVLVYDSGADMEGSGEEWPAVETIVNVTGEAPSPTTDSPTTATGATGVCVCVCGVCTCVCARVCVCVSRSLILASRSLILASRSLILASRSLILASRSLILTVQ